MRLQGKIAIVTGGSSGIGAAVAARFLAEGASVVVADIAIKDDRLATVGDRQFLHRVDVADPASAARLARNVAAGLSRIDLLVNSAGIGRDIAFLDTPADLFQKIVSVNLTGTFLVGQAAAREMMRTGGGRIINITSVSGRRGNVGRAAYGASKAGVVNLTQVMAIELAPHGILVNAIAPGPIETPLVAQMHTPEARRRWTARTALRRYGTPQEIAGAALFLASDDASYITGHVLDADGGFLAAGMLGEPD